MEVPLNKKRTMWGTVALLLVVSASSLYAGGFQLNEAGARAMAQADAFAARATDASAIFFNPAGIAFQKGHSILFGTTLFAAVVSLYGPVKDANDPNIATEWDMKKQVFNPINVYAQFEVTNKLHAGIAVNNPYGLGTAWPDNWFGNNRTIKIDLQTFYVTPTVAYQITDKFSVGAGFNDVFGSVLLKKAVNEKLGYIDPSPTVSLDLKAKNAYGWNVGAQYKLPYDISIGASYRSKVKIEATGTATFDQNYNSPMLPNSDASANITLPATGFAGISCKPMKNLEVEFDYQYIGWSSYDTLAVNFTNPVLARSADPKLYKDTYILRFGGEYTMGDVQIRAGYYFDHSPVPNETLEPLLPDSDRNGFNIGAGYQFTKSIHADISYMFLKGAQRKAEQTVSNINGTYNTYVNLLGINFGYNF